MSNYNLKAKRKSDGEIVEFDKYDDYEKGKGYLYQEPSGLHFNRNSIYNEQEFNTLYEPIPQTDLGVNTDTSKKDDILEDPYGGMEVLDNVPKETWEDRFNMEFVDEDTGLLNISKYDHERIINFINNEIK